MQDPQHPLPTSHTIPETVNAKWLQDLSRFGPAPDDPCIVPTTFDQVDPATPPWLAQLQDEWTKPTKFQDLWRDNWKTDFAALYAVTPQWQRLWRHGQGLPQRGYFVRGGLMFKIGCYCDRLCVPCPGTRIEILRSLHDCALAGHSGVHYMAARVQERYWWPGMWGDINEFVLSCATCQRNRAVKRAPWGSTQIIGTSDFCMAAPQYGLDSGLPTL